MLLLSEKDVGAGEQETAASHSQRCRDDSRLGERQEACMCCTSNENRYACKTGAEERTPGPIGCGAQHEPEDYSLRNLVREQAQSDSRTPTAPAVAGDSRCPSVKKIVDANRHHQWNQRAVTIVSVCSMTAE